jgi:hypothetical protein
MTHDDADDTTDPTAGTQGATALALLILMGCWWPCPNHPACPNQRRSVGIRRGAKLRRETGWRSLRLTGVALLGKICLEA